jgi:molecular chaperone Hsp33
MNDHPAGDYIVRAIAKEAGVRALACITTDLVREAARRHRSTPVATAALGYGLTAVALLGALIKVQQRVGLKVDGGGPLGKLVTESDSYGRVRGYISRPEVPWVVPVGVADVADALGRTGVLTVFKDLQMKEMYEGVVPIQTGELDSDLVYYLIKSEQVPSLVEIGVKVDERGEVVTAGGVLLQLLPGQQAVALVEYADRMDDLPPLEEVLADGQTPEQVLASLFGDVTYETLDRHPVIFRCSCSRERSQRALTLLSREDIELLLEEGEAVVDCHFCHERYVFDKDDLREILATVS